MYAESGATPKYKFAGMYYASDLGTYYTLNRFYNPTLARWTTRDPLGMVDGANVYGYVRQAPIRNSDFLGLKMGYCEALYTACIFDCNVAANTARVTLAMLLIDCIGACHAIIEVPILYACCLVTCWDVYNKAVGGIEKVRSACESGCAWLYKICTGNSPGP
jgi:RHS repeat-associated protein